MTTPLNHTSIVWMIPSCRLALFNGHGASQRCGATLHQEATSGAFRVRFRTSPLFPKEKFKIASEDAFDRGTLALAALFAGEAQLTNSTSAFGQGVKGYAQYLGTAYGDLVIGDMMTDAVYPVMLHQDPWCFLRGAGTVWVARSLGPRWIPVICSSLFSRASVEAQVCGISGGTRTRSGASYRPM